MGANTNKGYFPYLRIGKMNEILKQIPLQYISVVNEFSAKDMVSAIGAGASMSVVNNLIATLKSLDFVVGQRRFRFTRTGADYSVLIRTEEERAREILEEQTKNIGYFEVLRQELIRRKKLTIFEIGNEIVKRYGKNWTNPLTLKTYGAAIASIIDYTGFGHYRRGILRLKGEEGEGYNEGQEIVPVPYLSVEKMLKIMDALALFPEGCEIHELAAQLGTNERRLSQELACCRAMGFIRQSRRGFYELTEDGRAIARGNEGLRKEKFTEHLLGSGYKKLIDRLHAGAKITIVTLGDLLEEQYKRRWSATTKRTYAKKFLNWLRYSGIVVRVAGGYKLRTS